MAEMPIVEIFDNLIKENPSAFVIRRGFQFIFNSVQFLLKKFNPLGDPF